jgi:hypothetical protein
MRSSNNLSVFMLIFSTTLGLTAYSGAIATWCLFKTPNPSVSQQKTLDVVTNTWKLGSVTMISLLGYRSLRRGIKEE